jgi:hypothetical protein
MSNPSPTPKLSSTQIGAIGENLLVNRMMRASNGRLSPFKPVADDDGLDVLFFDKETGNSVAIQLKCRTHTDGKGKTAQFDVRKKTFKGEHHAYLVAALFNEDMNGFVCRWFIPMKELDRLGGAKTDKYVIRPRAEGADKYKDFRCESDGKLAQQIINACVSHWAALVATSSTP